MTEQIMALLKVSEGKLDQSQIYDLIDKIIASSFQKEVSKIIHCEFNDFMGFKKNEQGAAKAKGNARNGSYERKLGTDYGVLDLNIPRDRNGDFQTKMFDNNQRRIEHLDDAIKLLYAAGMTQTEIEKIVGNLYNNKLSQSTVSNISKQYSEEVKEFKNRQLQKEYFALFLDATYISLKRDSVDKESLNTIMGIDMNGQPEILTFCVAPSETKSTWEQMFEELRNRGVQTAKILVSDGFIGIEELMSKYLGEKCLYQRCCIHLERNLRSYVRANDQDAIAYDFKNTLHLSSKQDAYKAYDEFLSKWSKKYPGLISWTKRTPKETIYNFYEFPFELRTYIYTNNRIESLNSQIKRKARAHIQFPTQDSLERFAVTIFNGYNKTKGERHINHWRMISQLV